MLMILGKDCPVNDMNSVYTIRPSLLTKLLTVSQQQLLTAWRNASRMGPYGILIAVILYLLLLRELSGGNAALWLVIVVTLSLARWLLGIYYTHHAENKEEIQASLPLYVVMTAVVSSAWGGSMFLLDMDVPLVLIFIISVTISLISIVGVMGSFSVFLGAFASIFPITGLQIVWMQMYQPVYYEWISALMAVFTLLLSSLALAFCRQYKRVLGLIDDNADLVQNLTMSNGHLSEQIVRLEQAEQFAAAYEHRFQSLVETAPDAILVTNDEGKITFANESCLNKFGYLEEELLGQTVELLVPERFHHHREWRERFFKEASHTRMGRESEVFCRRKNGDEFAAEITLMPECINGDEFVYVYVRDISGQRYIDAIIHEIREKELAQSRLQSEKERLQTYMDNIEVVLVVVNEDMKVELINRKGRKLLGIIDQKIDDLSQLGGLLQRSYHENSEDYLRRVFEGETADNRFYLNSIVAPDGETHYFEWHLVETRDAEQRRYILASGSDISKRKRLEELITTVAVSLQAYTGDSLLNSLVQGLADTLCADHALIGRIVVTGQNRLESLAMWSSGSISPNISIPISGTPYENILNGQSHSVLDMLDEKYANEELIQRFGAKSYVAVPLFNPRREVIGILALFFRHALGNINLERNICNIYSVIAADEIERMDSELDKEQIQRQLQQAQKMESIGQLTGGVAHDFNNMLAGILGFTELALYRVGDGDEKLVQYLRNVYDTGEQAKELVSQMLTFSRKVRGEMQPLEIHTVVEEAVKMVRPMLPSSICMDVQVAKDLPCIDGDPVLLSQSILNLIINARDAIGEKGNIGIEVDLSKHVDDICTSCLQKFNGEMIEITVTDDGVGIVYDQLERIFEPFVTDKDIGKGTGMGLAMVHGIVHEHGGHVVVETSRSKGSVFKLYLPISTKTITEEGHGSMQNDSSTIDGTGRLVMVVDDEVMVATLLDEILSSYNYSVEVYNSSTEALAAYTSSPKRYDLVISDHTMPNMTGAELSQSILQLNPDQPIILCTGYSDYINEEKAEELGIAAFMHKPLDHAELMHTVDILTSTK